MGNRARTHHTQVLGPDAYRLVQAPRPGRIPELRRRGSAHPGARRRGGEVPGVRARCARLRHRIDRHRCRAGVPPAAALPLPLLYARRRPLRPSVPHQPRSAAADRRGSRRSAPQDPQWQRQPITSDCIDGKQMNKIWFQGATDKVHMAPYIAKVEAHLKSILEPQFEATFHTTTPPATTTHAITEFRIARNLIRNAVEAEKQGYAAMVITHFQDAGLAEVKSVVDIPVIGLGETTLMHSLTLGRKLGLVTINPVFIPWHEDQVIRYGLQQRVVGVRAVKATVKDFIDAFASEEAFSRLKPLWERECRVLLDAGADVIVPAGGLPMMLFSGEFEGAPVVNGVTLVAKTAEMAIKLHKQGMFKVSRRSNYVQPPEKALKEFLEQG